MYAHRHGIDWTGTVESDSFLGERHKFNVKDYITDRTNPTAKHSAVCDALFVLNKSGGTLARGSLVLPSDTSSYEFPFAVDGVAGTSFYCGQVSPWIASPTVADGDGFWLIIRGLTKLLYSGSGTILRGSFLETAATGRATLYSSGVFCGHSAEAINGSAAGTMFWAHLHGRA